MTTGVLLINTGTPEQPTEQAIRPYLREFLMDPAIIGAPYLIRKALVSRIVATRPQKTAPKYQAFWTKQGSPFMLTSREQARALAAALGPGFEVRLAMRYGKPSIAAGLEQLRAAGCTTVVLVPLYPQNVNVCAGTCFTEAQRQLDRLAKDGWQPCVVQVPSFHDQPAYRQALAEQVRSAWKPQPGAKLLVSFHSTLLRQIKRNPTYLHQTTQTKDWLAQDLGLDPASVLLSFQSRFDNRKWLQPFTDRTLRDLAASKTTNVCVVCPGFVTDNLETRIEVDQELRAMFTQAACAAGADPTQVRFTYANALGAHPGLIQALVGAIRNAL